MGVIGQVSAPCRLSARMNVVLRVKFGVLMLEWVVDHALVGLSILSEEGNVVLLTMELSSIRRVFRRVSLVDIDPFMGRLSFTTTAIHHRERTRVVAAVVRLALVADLQIDDLSI